MNSTHTARESTNNASTTLSYSTERPDPPDWSTEIIIGTCAFGSIVLFVLLCIAVRTKNKADKSVTSVCNESQNQEIECDCSDENITERDPNEMEPIEEELPKLPKGTLDWNKIFRFLASNIHAVSWRRLFDCLYGNTKLPTNINWAQTIDRIVLDKSSYGIYDTILEQFKAWKEAAGKNASPEVSEMSLIEMGHMDTVEIFKTYMRKNQ